MSKNSIDLGEFHDRLVVFGGPYGNLESTQAFLKAVDKLGVPRSHILCTGDMVAYCADAVATVALLQTSGAGLLLKGNCEERVGLRKRWIAAAICRRIGLLHFIQRLVWACQPEPCPTHAALGDLSDQASLHSQGNAFAWFTGALVRTTSLFLKAHPLRSKKPSLPYRAAMP